MIGVRQLIETIYGQLQGLKPSQLKQLQRLYRERLPGDCFATVEFAQRVAAISTELGKPLCTYLNRRGRVIRVGVGTPHATQIPPLELPRYGAERLCGLRCLATSLEAEPPAQASLTAMAVQRLDALVTISLTGSGFQRRGGGATGYIKEAYLAHLIPQTHPEVAASANWKTSEPMSLESLSEEDFAAWVAELEAEFQREFVAREVDEGRDRVVAVCLHTDRVPAEEFEESVAELIRLVETAGGEVVQVIRQKRSRPNSQTVVGAGKVREIALAAQTTGANPIVFDRDLSPAQARNLEAQIGTRVIDRTEIILDIFAQRAQSKAGKLQVELAQLEYRLPRLTGRGQAMSRLGGGIGTRGPGETQLETERRSIQRRLTRLQQDIDRLQNHRSRLRQQRQKQEIPTVAIAGYTNAGKSTLINALTNAEVHVEDKLFATLDPTTRRLAIPHALTGDPLTILLTDTVGFIQELPPPLVDAFRATLEEVTEADALLHLVDLSHPAWQNHIRSVTKILGQMPIAPGPVLLAFNKIDCASGEALKTAREEYPLAVFISARKRLGLDTLRHKLAQLVHYATTSA